MKRGQIYLANLYPGKGSEPGKTRPVFIVQDQALIDVEHPSTLIIPLTTQLIEDAEPLRLRLAAKDKLNKTSDLLIDQLRAIDNRRLIGEALLQCPDAFMEQVNQCMQEVLGMLATDHSLN
ncbi:type II toxin-antitoxin system PemK/MazF family toxin [Mariprofundus sp. EBB-1]|uniref:type II toxin-antitoxin system PemK/MazF family toxin n=1 Tax=Mariprofundus sp. EBB-1 TaxID=2650971 RepID=UPI001913A996|nr:type II toxin-antitoxin system PemK/MazF family toxin [Mariprofundus sp. EBB-1]